jgi:serine/threonine-protein kinase ATR
LSQLSNAGDPAAFAALVSGAADLTEDAADALRAQPSRTRRGWPIGQHAGHGHAMVLCSFLEALRVARAAAGEEGPDTPPLERVARSAHAASAGTAPERAAPEMGLALEVSGADAADALMRAACKLLTHALRLGPQIAAGFVSPSVSRALAYAAAAPNASIATRRAALSALRSAAAEVPAATFPAEACLRAVAETMRERAGGGAGATPPPGRDRDAFDAELAACLDAAVAAGGARAAATVGDDLACAAVAVIEAGDEGSAAAVGEPLRASSFRALVACVAARPPLASVLVPLLSRAGAADVADALVECLEPVFAEAALEWDYLSNDDAGGGRGGGEEAPAAGSGSGATRRRGAGEDETDGAPRGKRRRVTAGKDGWVGGGVGGGDRGGAPGLSGAPPERSKTPTSFEARPGGASDETLDWIEDCVVSALAQLGPSAPGALAASTRAKTAAGIARVAVAAGRRGPRLRHAAAASAHDWLKWARRARDAGDGAVADAFAASLDAADAILRVGPSSEDARAGASGAAPPPPAGPGPAFDAGDLAEDTLMWPWSQAADDAPAAAKRAAKTAAARAALSALAARGKPAAGAIAATRKVVRSGLNDGDDAVRAAAACAAAAAHLLASGSGGDARAVVGDLARLAETANDAGKASPRAAAATATGMLAGACAALSAKSPRAPEAFGRGGRGGGASASTSIFADLAMRARVADAARRAVAAAADSDDAEREAAAAAFDALVVEGVDRARSAGGGDAGSWKTALCVGDAARTIAGMLSVGEDGVAAAAALDALRRVLHHAGAHEEALKGAAALSDAATALALHPSASARDALCVAAPALASRGVLLDAAPDDGGSRRANDGGRADAIDRAAVAAGLSLLQRLKTNVEDAGDAATRESALRTFAAAAAAMPHPDALTAALIVILRRLDDADAGVRAVAVSLVRSFATRRGVRPRDLLLGNRLVATHLGVALPNSPGLLATLAEALLQQPERSVLVELLPAAVPRLVERQDVATLRAYAARLGREYTVAGILTDWCYVAIADLINNSQVRTHEEVESCKKFLVSQTGVELEVLVADHKKELMKTLIRSAGADDAVTSLQAEAGRLETVLDTLARLAASSSGSADATPSVPDFLRPHFTWLVMGDADDRGGDAAARRRFLRSLTIMVHLIGPHLPQFAPKVMAHLASALEKPSATLRREALMAWLLLVKQLAKYAPGHLRRVAGRIVVAMLPHLPDESGVVPAPKANGDRRGSFGGDADDESAAEADNAALAADVIEELVLRSGAKHMKNRLARLPTLPECDRLARANAAVRVERGEAPLPSLLATLTDGAEDESQAVRATALGELRRALRADPAAVSALVAGAEEDAAAPAVVGRLVAALLRCCASDNRTVISRRVQRLAVQCLGELGAIDPGRVDLPAASAEKLGDAVAGSELARKLLCDHVARAVRGANDVDMLDAAALAVQEVLVHVGCRPASVRAEDVVAPDAAVSGTSGTLPAGATAEGEAFWASLPEDVRALLAPGLTSMYCLTQKPPRPDAARPLYHAPGGPTFRRWMYAWCRALAAEATGADAPLFAACSAGVFRHDTRTMLFLLPRMVLDALASRDERRATNVKLEIMAVLRDAAGAAWGEGDGGGGGGGFGNAQLHTSQSKSLHGEQAELAAQATFTLLDQLTARREDVARTGDAEDDESEGALAALLDSIPRKLLARAALRCGAPARALLYFEGYLRGEKNVLNQAALRHGEPEGGGLDDASAAFLAATHRALAEPDAFEAVARLRSRGGPGPAGGAAGGASSDATAAARRRAEDALLQHEEAGEWTEALTHYESALQRTRGSLPAGESSSSASAAGAALDPAEWGRLRCLQGLGHLRALEREAAALIPGRPAARAELAEAGAAASWRLGRWDALENFLGVLDAESSANAAPGAAGGGFGGAHGRPGGEAAIGRVLLGLRAGDAAAVRRAATAARDAVITPLAAAAMEGSYRRAHPAIVQLHLIREAEEAMAAHEKENEGEGTNRSPSDPSRTPRELLSDWDRRLDLTPPALATREPILALRRAAYASLRARDAAAYTWLAQAKLCRASGHHGAAQLALLEARSAMEGAAMASAAGEERARVPPGSRRGGSVAGAGARSPGGDVRPAPGMALAVEQAKLLWATGRQHRAMVEIQEALDDSNLRGADPGATSRAMLRLARWSAATGQRSKTDVLNIYSNVLRDQRHTEKANFHVAKYMDDLLKDAMRREKRRAESGVGDERVGARALRGRNFDVDERSTDYVIEVITHYATSLRYGHRHVYETLPRMLTLWFDITSAAAAHERRSKSSSSGGASGRERGGLTPDQQRERKVATQATNVLKDFTQRLPLYTWLPALPQLTSRLCHPHDDARGLIHELLYRLVKNFPNQVLWSMTAMARSTHPERAQAAQRVLDRAKDGAPSAARPLFDQSAALADQLIRVCAFQPKPVGENKRTPKTFSVKAEFPALRRLTPCAVMVPGQAALTPSLPPPSARNAANANQVPTVSEWSAFPADVATIAGVEDEVCVMASLQKPKKLTVQGSDGETYSFLCKPKDDLRKDLRMMEFTTMLNRMLSRDPSSRKRRLYLRTFAVIPLTEDCGLIEWVPNTTGLRHVIQALYVRDGLYHKRTLIDVKEMHERLKSTPSTWMSEILKKFPPVFHRWFLNRWKDRPAAWHGARTAFAHTAAVWSVVGHVVGLGDRHGENILLDQESGDVVHIDFSCLFDKGLELECPEMVPFRLTQNIVDGLGAGGYEGTFMRVCEITLQVLRSHREALMSVLETFVHDPLVEWSKAVKSGAGTRGGDAAKAAGRDETAEQERGKEALEKIRSRLEGVVVGVGSAPSLPLSPQGQARRLIEEATSRKSLGAMYIWWMAWF